jgi:hypothetical protein
MCARLDTTGIVADIIYTIFHRDTAAAHERCCLYRRADGGYWMTADLDSTGYQPVAQYVEIHAEADWRIESLDIRLSGSVRRDATHRADGLTWRATIQTDEATIEQAVRFGPDMTVDFNSVWLKAITFNRLKLAPGQVSEMDVVQIKSPSLETVLARQRYECMAQSITTQWAIWTRCTVSPQMAITCGPPARHCRSDAAVVNGLPQPQIAEYHWLG